MCGIAALLKPPGLAEPIQRLVKRMSDVVRYRGPDDEGYAWFSTNMDIAGVAGGADTPEGCYSYESRCAPRSSMVTADPAQIALGHRRLAILDVSVAGHQPMCSDDGSDWIIYNGEIYNYIELRAELAGQGHVFRTRTDTEVILAAYRAWGKDCLSRFNGMFAFLILDRRRGKLFGARDRFGVKPLYYWRSSTGLLAFASEIKQFSVLPGWTPRVNGQRAYDFVNWAVSDHTDETLFEGVFQLRGGEALELDIGADGSFSTLPGGRLTTYRWYNLKPCTFTGSLENTGREFRRLLTDSVRLRLRADVPVGSCLSGGLDSSSIVCVMNELLREQGANALQKTFSACSDSRRFDEREYIEEVVRHTGTDAKYVYPRLDGVFELLDRMTWHQDEPFGSTSIYAQWHVFRLAAEAKVKVMLDGQGADEQLAGYHNYFAARFGSLFRELRWAALWRELLATSRLHGYPLTWGVQQTLNNVLPESLRQPLRRLAGRASINTPCLDLARIHADARDPFFSAGAARAPSVRAMSGSQLVATALPKLLHWEDRDSMAHSVEARVPFLDYRLVEFSLGLPDDQKISNGETKRVLREGLRGLLPERVRTRIDKLGFVTPEEEWVRNADPDGFRAALRAAIESSRGIIRPNAMQMLERTIEGRQPYDFLIWRLISFGSWMRRFDVHV